MKFAKFFLMAALISPFFANAQESTLPDLSAPPTAPSMPDPALNPVPNENPISQPSTPSTELGENKKISKKKAKKSHPKKSKKHAKKAKKAHKKKKHHA